jgi:hypothetical protein
MQRGKVSEEVPLVATLSNLLLLLDAAGYREQLLIFLQNAMQIKSPTLPALLISTIDGFENTPGGGSLKMYQEQI